MNYRFWTCLLVGSFLIISCESLPPEVPKQDLVTLTDHEAQALADSIELATPVTLAEGLHLHLWASDSLLADPVALYMDPKGRAYVTSTSRGNHSEFDIRGHQDWMTRSISFQTVTDRRAFLREILSPDHPEENDWFPDLNQDGVSTWKDLTVEKEKVIRIEDTDGDGLADQSHTFVEGFHEEISDVAGGFTEHNGSFYLGVAPDFWKLEDRNGDGTVDEMVSLANGFQVHIGFGGHGMSGVKVGPDGRMYWGIGDIGSNIVDRNGKQRKYPNQGAIFRANPDGSEFEVFAAGLRNTHEFDFDAYGNLITVDNDGDYPGEKERLMYVVEGSDAGWRSNWQYGKYTDPKNNRYNVWMDERMFVPRHEGQAAHIIPPIMNYHSGPTGLKYQPGTALGGRWPNHFFVVEFPGSPARAKIHAFELEASGAGFQMKQEEVIAKGVLATGLDIGADGNLYFSDWITGWTPKSYGRIWKLSADETDPELQQEVQMLMNASWSEMGREELLNHLAHVDRRIRQHAQFELANRGRAVVNDLLTLARTDDNQLARIHAIWAYAQAVRAEEAKALPLSEFLSDSDPEIRTQTAKMLGDLKVSESAPQLMDLLDDSSARVIFFATEALRKIGDPLAAEAILQMLERNNDQDVYLRFAGAAAFAAFGNPDYLRNLSEHPLRAVRIAAVVALRRMAHPAVADFLADEDEWVATEAARAINDDWSIEEALPALAQTEMRFMNEPFVRRVINANVRVGNQGAVEKLIQIAQDGRLSVNLREEAILALSSWDSPSETDRVDGRYRGIVSRSADPVRQSMDLLMPALLESEEIPVAKAACTAIGRLGMAQYTGTMIGFLRNHPSKEVRGSAIQAVATIGGSKLQEAISLALRDQAPEVRSAALSLVPDLPLSQEERITLLNQMIETGKGSEKQAAMSALMEFPSIAISSLLDEYLAQWEQGTIDPILKVELTEIIEEINHGDLTERLERLQSEEDPLLQYADLLVGGNVNEGRGVVYWNSAGQCVRCHSVGSQQGADVGPNLDGVGARLSRESILLSLVAPSAEYAAGYGTAVITKTDGEVISGVLIRETDNQYHLQTERVEPVRISKGNVEDIKMAPSAMPNMTYVLSRREIRDVVEYLSQLQ